MNRIDRDGFHPRIESLRGIAALLVAGAHAAYTPWGRLRLFAQPALDAAPPTWGVFARVMHYVVMKGQAPVVLFFVLSGFVLSLSLDRGPASFSSGARRFFIARIFRLYPACFLTVGLFALVYYCVGASLPRVEPASYSASSILRNALLFDYSINGIMWTLQIELKAIPWVFAAHLLRRRVGEAGLVTLSIALVLVLFSKGLSGLLYPGTFAFMFGMLVPSLGRAAVERLSLGKAAMLAFSTVAAFFLARPTVLQMGLEENFAILPEAFVSAVFIALLVYGPPLGAYRLLDLAVVRFYGRISYSFYLLHPLTLLVIWNIPDTVRSWIEAGIPSVVIALMFWLVTTVAVTPLAAAAYSFVERPGVRLGRRFAAPADRAAALELRDEAVAS